MKALKINKQIGKNVGINPMVATVAGTVIGAGIAVAGVALSDEKNRKRVMKFANNIKKGLITHVEETQEQAETKKKALGKKISKDKEIVNKAVNAAKISLHKTTKEVNNAIKSL